MKIVIKIEDDVNRKIRFVVENSDPDTAFLAACRALNSLRKEKGSGEAENRRSPRDNE